jgi:hypothetical protein
MTRVGLLLKGITEHTRRARTGDLTRQSSMASLGAMQSSCERCSRKGNELRFILEGIEDKAALQVVHEGRQQETGGVAKTMGGGGDPVRTGSTAWHRARTLDFPRWALGQADSALGI